VKMQSRLEEEEQAKAALMGRIQRLTKLILVSTKNTIPPVIIPEKPNNRRRHSFGEEEVLACLSPYNLGFDSCSIVCASELSCFWTADDSVQVYRGVGSSQRGLDISGLRYLTNHLKCSWPICLIKGVT